MDNTLVKIIEMVNSNMFQNAEIIKYLTIVFTIKWMDLIGE